MLVKKGSLWKLLTCTVPFYDLVGITIMMKKPKVPTSLFKFLTVLENSVWGCILAAYFFTSFLMWVFDKFSPYSYQNNVEKYKDDEEKRFFNFKECLWFCMTSLTPQGGGEYSSDFLKRSQNLTKALTRFYFYWGYFKLTESDHQSFWVLLKKSWTLTKTRLWSFKLAHFAHHSSTQIPYFLK